MSILSNIWELIFPTKNLHRPSWDKVKGNSGAKPKESAPTPKTHTVRGQVFSVTETEDGKLEEWNRELHGDIVLVTADITRFDDEQISQSQEKGNYTLFIPKYQKIKSIRALGKEFTAKRIAKDLGSGYSERVVEHYLSAIHRADAQLRNINTETYGRNAVRKPHPQPMLPL